MLLAHLRDQRAASINRSLQSTARHRQLVASSSGAASKTDHRRARGAASGVTSKGSHTAAARTELANEIREARGQLELDTPELNTALADGELVRSQGKENAIEVPLVSLVVPSRRNTASDFEIVSKCKGVIALDNRDFSDSSSPELGAVRRAETDEDDEWELLGLDEEEGGVKEPKSQGKSWAAVVGRA